MKLIKGVFIIIGILVLMSTLSQNGKTDMEKLSFSSQEEQWTLVSTTILAPMQPIGSKYVTKIPAEQEGYGYAKWSISPGDTILGYKIDVGFSINDSYTGKGPSKDSTLDGTDLEVTDAYITMVVLGEIKRKKALHICGGLNIYTNYLITVIFSA